MSPRNRIGLIRGSLDSSQMIDNIITDNIIADNIEIL